MADRWMTADELVDAVREEAILKPGDIERWSKLDLLPRSKRQRRTYGRGGFDSLGYPPGTLRQLRALLRIRQDTDDTNASRVLLWLVGFPVPPDKMKKSLCAALQRAFSPVLDDPLPENEEANWDWAESVGCEIASKRPRTRFARALHRRLGQATDLVNGVSALAVLSRGEKLSVTPEWEGLPRDGPPLGKLLDCTVGLPPRSESEASKDWDRISAQGLMSCYALYKALSSVEEEELASLRGPAMMLGFGISGMLQQGVTLADNMAGRELEAHAPNRETAGYVALAIAALLLARDRQHPNVREFIAALDKAAKEVISPATNREG